MQRIRTVRAARRWWSELAGRALVAVTVAVMLLVVGFPEPAAAAEPAWTWPLPEPAQVVRPFDPPEHRYAAGHRGADLTGSPGAPVLAAGAGRVSYAGLLAGRGVVVVVHGELRTTYEPVTAQVLVGQQVVAGESIGRVEPGHTGCPVAACLHWGLRRGDTYLDPVQLVDPGPARLLPVGPVAPVATLDGAAPAPVEPAQVSAPRRVEPPGGAPAATVTEPHWSLRAAEAPLGAAAVVALAAGLALVARPRRPPDGPPTAGSAATLVVPKTALPDPAPAVLPVDLEVERIRRRAAS